MFEARSGLAAPPQRTIGSLPRGTIIQAGAICCRQIGKDGPIEALLIASLRNGRWGIPKGHVEIGETTRQTAQREAFEEAGVTGHVEENVFGAFTYSKEGNPNRFHVSVHVLIAKELAENFPEKNIRKARWVPIGTAVKDLDQPELSEMFASLLRENASRLAAQTTAASGGSR